MNNLILNLEQAQPQTINYFPPITFCETLMIGLIKYYPQWQVGLCLLQSVVSHITYFSANCHHCICDLDFLLESIMAKTSISGDGFISPEAKVTFESASLVDWLYILEIIL